MYPTSFYLLSHSLLPLKLIGLNREDEVAAIVAIMCRARRALLPRPCRHKKSNGYDVHSLLLRLITGMAVHRAEGCVSG